MNLCTYTQEHKEHIFLHLFNFLQTILNYISNPGIETSKNSLKGHLHDLNI